ncbi:DUF2236 domain-containing protein [Streptomyces thinghirensis]|nr:DUF2236 domain-containing protein [Streptomyces thinghirensis]
MIRATVLEAAHPQIGAALVDNSTFVAHPWRRLRNTFLSMRRVFGADLKWHGTPWRPPGSTGCTLRTSGSDARGRSYDAMDRAARLGGRHSSRAPSPCAGSEVASRSTRTPWSRCTPSTVRS